MRIQSQIQGGQEEDRERAGKIGRGESLSGRKTRAKQTSRCRETERKGGSEKGVDGVCVTVPGLCASLLVRKQTGMCGSPVKGNLMNIHFGILLPLGSGGADCVDLVDWIGVYLTPFYVTFNDS